MRCFVQCQHSSVPAAIPEKMDSYTKLRTTSGTINIHLQCVAQLVITNIVEIHYDKENKTNWGQQIKFSEESIEFETKNSKVGINEMFSNC